MPLSLSQLETFRVISRERNLTRTAERLGFTQPAISQQLRALQEHFRVKLIDVVGRQTVLTDAGEFLAARLDSLLGSVETLEREMREFADVRAGELRIGATVTIGTYVLPALIARFRAAHPAIELSVTVENTETIVASLEAGRVSFALVEGPLEDPGFDIDAFADDELIVIAPPAHPLARRRGAVHARELAELAFVFRETGSGTRQQVEAAFVKAGIAPQIALSLPSGEGIVRAVSLGLGCAIVSRLVADDALAARSVARVAVRGLDLKRTLRVVRMKGHTQSPASRAFDALLFSPTFPSRAKSSR